MTNTTPEAAERVRKREIVATAIFGNPKPRDGSALPFAEQPAFIRKSFLDSADRVLAALAAQEGGGERATEVSDTLLLKIIRDQMQVLERMGCLTEYGSGRLSQLRILILEYEDTLRAAQEGTGNG